MNLRFTGHETFICKHFWPKKGIDFLLQGNKFSDQDAVIKLGVGKNMVSSIRYWIKSIGLVDTNENPTEIAKMIFSDDGYDPFLEDIGTVWLLHYLLVSSNIASIYNLVFNELSKQRLDFTKSNLHSFLKQYTRERNPNIYNEKSFGNDINVFLRNYVKPDSTSKVSVEDEFIGLFLDLELITKQKHSDIDNKMVEIYSLERKERENIPIEIFLVAIIEQMNGTSISFKELANGFNSVGNIFLINRDGIHDKIENITKLNYGFTYSQSAGNQTLNVSTTNLNSIEILRAYYEG